ncbi:MAG TPA: glycosyltransferase [Acidimicrobiia bacterium]|nr:glycosyltransferase [Acidimicrobiia bacterium]
MTTPKTSVEVDVVICTYDNPELLDRVLSALGAQERADGGWRVTVVDNNSPDTTRAVVERHIQSRALPELRRVVESEQGLTPARRCGVRSTTAPWIAFVDDDCLLDERWIERALAFARAHPECGGFGGRVSPEYASGAPALLSRYGWAFAEQDLGEVPTTVDCLVGAGMVLHRSALEASGWIAGPYFADRVGRKLVSGGDVEIALRVAATGRALWYVPDCTLRHVIPRHRTAPRYLVRMTRGLGVSYSLAQALLAPGSPRAWFRATAKDLVRAAVVPLKMMRRITSGADARLDARLTASYEIGRWFGAARVLGLLVRGRCDYFGKARAVDGRARADHVVHAD